MASEVRLGTERLRYPFHLAAVPAGLRPVASTFDEGGLSGPWRADLTFHPADGGTEMRVTAAPTRPGDRDPNTTVDGHEARRDQQTQGPQYYDGLVVYDVSGLDVSVFVTAESSLDPDGTLGVYRGLTVHPEPSGWTDRPLR